MDQQLFPKDAEGKKQEQEICKYLEEQETSWNIDETVEMSLVQQMS